MFSCKNICIDVRVFQYMSLYAVHGFEQLSYTTPESVTLQGVNFRPNVKGTGQPANIGIISGTIVLEEDTASKFIQCLFCIARIFAYMLSYRVSHATSAISIFPNYEFFLYML